MARYSGSWLTYTIFSFVFLVVLISGFYRQLAYGYLFLSVMLWLGFWFKLAIHLLLDYPFIEPVGFFDGSASSWDEVLKVGTLGGAGVLVGRLLFGLGRSPSSLDVQGTLFKVPEWYPAIRNRLWFVLIAVCIGVAIANVEYGIMQIGLVPRTILLWPINAVIAWLLSTGMALGVVTLLWWDIAVGRNISAVVYVVLLEGFTSTVSLLSRGSYIFHVIPSILALFYNRKMVVGWSRRNITAVSSAFFVLLAISNPLVNVLRSHYYSNEPLRLNEPILSGVAGFAKFAVDRWIGLEGVMAVSAYPGKNTELFVQGISEQRKVGKVTFYQEICQSSYRFSDVTKFQFASLPGAIGFLYYAGKTWIVVLGMCVLVLVLLVSETLVFRATGNPLVCALWGGMTANFLTQLAFPRSMWIHFAETVVGIATICLLQSKCFSKLLQKMIKVGHAR